MATSQHVQLAEKEFQQNKSAAQSTVDNIVIPTDILPEEKRATVHNVLFKLVKKKKGSTYLDNCCDNVPNPKNNGIPERIWALNGVRSIWDSELEYLFKDKNRYEAARKGRDIKFVDGVLRVSSTDKLLLEFLRANTHNVGDRRVGCGKFDFYEYNPAKEQEERHKKQLMKVEMVAMASTMDITKAKKLASFFGIPFVDELGMAKTDAAIRTELMLKADTDPAAFQKNVDSREVEIAYLVKRAILDSKIDVGGADGNARWADGKGLICKIPVNRKHYEYLTELAMTNSEDGKQFKEHLEKIIT